MLLLFAGLHCTSVVTQLETEFRNKVSFHPLAQCSLAGFQSQIIIFASAYTSRYFHFFPLGEY